MTLRETLEMEGLTEAEIHVLLHYSAVHGENWRDALAADWRRGSDVAEGDRLVPDGGCYLRALRNRKGPTWLYGLRLT